jgi:hypothetical protein
MDNQLQAQSVAPKLVVNLVIHVTHVACLSALCIIAVSVAAAAADRGGCHLLTVTTANDVVDGDTDSTCALLSDVGADGEISLREAVIASNNTPGPDTINFAIGIGVQTITLGSPLSPITDTTVIDGTTQPGYAGSPMIELDGSAAGADVDGLTISGHACTICGLIINRFTRDGIVITGDSGLVVGNYVGTNAAGDAGSGNGQYGIVIQGGGGNAIGGVSEADRNVSSGNLAGILLTGGASGNLIRGTYTGTGASGSAAIPNLTHGIILTNGVTNNTIGGLEAEARNVVSGNSGRGISIENATTTGNTIQGNYIGTASDGTTALGNGQDGIYIAAPQNMIGGADDGAGNVIANNGLCGVTVVGDYSGISILGNSVYSNADLGIDLNEDGITYNDVDDGDTGPNDKQNFPTLDSATASAVDVCIYGFLNSTSGTSFRIEFFAGSAADPSGFGEGKTYLGSTNVITDSGGDVHFSVALPVAVSIGDVIAATATNPSNGTSEFSDTALVTISTVSIILSNPTFAFGTNTPDAWLAPEISVITNNGTVAENFIGRISQFTDGTNIWGLSDVSNGDDLIRAQWSTVSDTGPWNDIIAYDTDFTIATNVAIDDSVTFWFRIETPISTSSYSEHSCALTVTAQQY